MYLDELVRKHTGALATPAIRLLIPKQTQLDLVLAVVAFELGNHIEHERLERCHEDSTINCQRGRLGVITTAPDHARPFRWEVDSRPDSPGLAKKGTTSNAGRTTHSGLWKVFVDV